MLSRAPGVKRAVKTLYYRAGALISDKKSDMPGLTQVSSDGAAHNFGYYDKSPWSADGRYMIYLAPPHDAMRCASADPTAIVLFDTATREERILAHTRTWNSQQGCMLQWLGPDYSSRILFNDFRDGRYCSVVLTVETGEQRVLQMPVYSVSGDGKTAITLDFSRLHTFRPGYGYCNRPDDTRDRRAPDAPCMWRLDLENDAAAPLPITYKDLAHFHPAPSMAQGFHKVNHIMLNPSGSRFMFIHRWIVDGKVNHRLFTCGVDGRDLYLLLDDGMVSHNNWKDDEVLISYCHSNADGDGYHILRDRTQQRELIGAGVLTQDGHPSYSPDGRYIVTDTYPDLRGKQRLYLIRTSDCGVKLLGSVYSSPRHRELVRCDLHPRWSRDGKEICIDAAPGKRRQVFTVPAAWENEE